MAFAAPGISRVAARGVERSAFAAAAADEGFEVDAGTPEGWVIWSPERNIEDCDVPVASARAVCVVAPGVKNPPLPNLAAHRTARISMTLRDWVSRWPGGGILRPFLVPEAVGGRSCTVAMPGQFEWIYTSSPPPMGESRGAGHKREMAVTFLGAGFFPIMPATLASALLVPPALLLHALSPVTFQAVWLAVALAATVAGVALERWAGRWFLAEDPREFVLDEVAGMALAWALLPEAAGWPYILLAFLLFRVFHIFKWGISWIESLPVRGTIVWDDLLAGIYAGIGTILIHAILGGGK
jgi:phosphatidylglycerophosphatase A